MKVLIYHQASDQNAAVEKTCSDLEPEPPPDLRSLQIAAAATEEGSFVCFTASNEKFSIPHSVALHNLRTSF